MIICIYLGLAFIIFGLIYVFLRHDSDKTELSIKNLTLSGNTGVFLILFGIILVLIGSGVSLQNFLNSANDQEKTADQQETTGSAIIQSTSVFETTKNSELGIEIDALVNTNNLQGQNCVACAYFYTTDGVPLQSYNQAYSNPNGYLFSCFSFTPFSIKTTENIVIFTPYNAFGVDPSLASYELGYTVVVYDEQTALYNTEFTIFTIPPYF